MHGPFRNEAPSHLSAAEGGATSRRRVGRSRGVLTALTRDLGLGVLAVVAVVGLWELAEGKGWVTADTLPPPTAVGRRVADLLLDGGTRDEVLNTLWTWVSTMVLACGAAIPLGALIGYLPKMFKPTVGIIHASRSVPLVALIPVAILLFGLGTTMKVALTSFAIFWPILLNTIYGVRGTEPQLLLVARSMRWTRRRILWRVIVPAAIPYVVTGIRVAGGIALIVILSTEIIGASNGLGHVIVVYQENVPPRPDYVYAGIILIGLLGILLYSTLIFLEKRLIPWTNASRRE